VVRSINLSTHPQHSGTIPLITLHHNLSEITRYLNATWHSLNVSHGGVWIRDLIWYASLSIRANYHRGHRYTVTRLPRFIDDVPLYDWYYVESEQSRCRVTISAIVIFSIITGDGGAVEESLLHIKASLNSWTSFFTNFALYY